MVEHSDDNFEVRLNKYVTRLRSFVWLIAVTGLWGHAARASEVKLELNTSTGFVGEPISGEIHVSNFSECEAPTIPEVDGLRIIFTGIPVNRYQSYTYNGRTETKNFRTYALEIIPEREGAFVLPPIELTVDGKTMRTAAARLRVGKSDGQRLLWAEVTSTVERAYVGQRIPLKLTIYVKPAIYNRRYLEYQEMQRFFSVLELGVFQDKKAEVRKKAIDDGNGDAQLYYLFEISVEFTPSHPGRLQFDDIVVGMRYPLDLTSDFFGDMQLRKARNLRVSPDAADIDVQALPSEGRPPGFTGAIGKVNIRVLAEPRNVRVGDPIQLTIDLFGNDANESLPAPNLSACEALTAEFRVPQEELAGEITDQYKRFTQTIRAKSDKTRYIPPIEYSYFDTEKGEYQVAHSDRVPLNITPTEVLDASDLAIAPNDGGQSRDANTTQLDGLRGNIVDTTEVLQSVKPVTTGQVVAAAVAPPAICMLGWLGLYVSRRQGGSEKIVRRKKAATTARARIDRAVDTGDANAAAEISGALSHYLADRFDKPTAAFVGADAAQELTRIGLPRDVVEQVRRCIAECDSAAYGGASQSVPGLASAARECIDQIERAV
ncbi:MAG: BatD family protein [Phycisphaerae bacterium]